MTFKDVKSMIWSLRILNPTILVEFLNTFKTPPRTLRRKTVKTPYVKYLV